MNVLVIGSGGREHALVWKIKQSPFAGKVFVAPGNGGISRDAKIFDLPADFETLASFAENRKIGYVVVGPEVPLINGIADFFANRGIPVFGPSREAAMLEGSKIFAKKFMKKNRIPTAEFEIFDKPEDAIKFVKNRKNIVVKADGLCAGKGVVVCDTGEEAHNAIKRIMADKIFGSAGERIVIERKLVGEEASVLVLFSDKGYVPLIPARDHKPAFDGGRGPNTGGMGAYAPAISAISEKISGKIEREIIKPLAEGIRREGISYFGVLYIGLMIVNGAPYVLEFNVRFGDPETQAILPLLKNDLMEVFMEMEDGGLPALVWENGFCVDVVLASGGYPGKCETGKKITFAKNIPSDIMIFHAGTELKNGNFFTSGGRVLNVAACGGSLKKAREKVYGAVSKIGFEGMFYRKDIGK
ncbi:MAG: phosphoribosylamine--glycine ligase [Elusimicrobia bacterium]|nr:phosphoribosylamine--glycine ligase [Elusimicrobiota bacterium]